MTPDDPRHGTPKGYHAHKRDNEAVCDACRDAVNAYESRRRSYRTIYGRGLAIDAVGVRRRVQALYWLGHRAEDIATAGGWANAADITQMVARRWVSRATFDRIVAVYDRLSMTEGPSTLTRHRAVAARYAPPLAWDDATIDDPDARPNTGGRNSRVGLVDHVVIQRRLDGQPTRKLTPEEVLEVVRIGKARGFGSRQFESIGVKSERYGDHVA